MEECPKCRAVKAIMRSSKKKAETFITSALMTMPRPKRPPQMSGKRKYKRSFFCLDQRLIEHFRGECTKAGLKFSEGLEIVLWNVCGKPPLTY